MLGVCLAAPNCKGFATWGAHDGDSWLRARPRFDGLTAPVLFDESLRAKPAYEAITRLLKSQ